MGAREGFREEAAFRLSLEHVLIVGGGVCSMQFRRRILFVCLLCCPSPSMEVCERPCPQKAVGTSMIVPVSHSPFFQEEILNERCWV